MQCVLVAPRAVLLELHTLRIVLLVLLGGVVATLALSARESNQSTHEFLLIVMAKTVSAMARC